MKAFAFVTTLMTLAFGLRTAIEHLNWLAAYDAELKAWVDTKLELAVHSLLTRIYRTCAALALFTAVDVWWLPWLRIQDMVMGWGSWKQVHPVLRGCVALGWFITLSSLLVAFNSGIA